MKTKTQKKKDALRIYYKKRDKLTLKTFKAIMPLYKEYLNKIEKIENDK